MNKYNKKLRYNSTKRNIINNVKEFWLHVPQRGKKERARSALIK